jgi:DeoR/GlpR family transcriptional regulator of sugar metabolism
MDFGSTVGPVGFNSGNINVDTAIIGVSGLTATDGLSTTFLQEASMLARMITSARRTLIVADASKFGHNAFANIAPLSAIAVLVTDAPPSADLSQALSLAKAEVIVALPARSHPSLAPVLTHKLIRVETGSQRTGV